MAEFIDREKINEIAFTDAVLVKGEVKTEKMTMAELKDLVGELLSLNAENLAQRCIDNSDVEWCLSELMDMLAADMEAVTRCEDCKHYDRGECYHPRHENHLQSIPQQPDDFCSYGERKEHE